MSYCRLSSDDWKCELYLYKSCRGGWDFHVAGRKPVINPPVVPNILKVSAEEFAEAHKKQMEFLDTVEYRKINLPYAGESFNCATLEETIEKVKELKSLGYRIPDYVLERLERELAEAR